MKRLLIALALIACFASRYSALPAYADCTATSTPTQTYASLVEGTQTAHLIAFWQLDETSGSTAQDSSGNGRIGVYNGPTVNGTTFTDGAAAPTFDGVNDYINVYSTALSTAFNNQELSFLAWFKVNSSSDWTDGVNHRVFQLQASTSYLARFMKSNTNQFEGRYTTGATAKVVQFTLSATTWTQVALTVSKSADQLKVYLNGTQQGSTQTSLGTWSGALDTTQSVIGASGTTPSQVWDGAIAKVAVWDTPLTSSEISALSSSPSATPTPVATCTPSPTQTPSATLTPSNTPTPTITPSATLNLYTYVTVIPPGGGLSDAQGGAIKYEVTAGQIIIALLLFAIFLIAVVNEILKARGR